MGITNVRLYVASLYPSEKWKQQVSRMADRQVYAIFRRTEAAKEHALYLPKEGELEKPTYDWPIYEGEQLSIFDYE